MKKHILIGLSLCFSIFMCTSQTFEPTRLPFKNILSDGAMSVADFDNDGDQDVVISGLVEHLLEGDVINGGIGFTGIYRNDDGEFSYLENLDLIEVWYSAVAFGDFDGDQDMDLIVSGKPTGPATSNTLVLKIYMNEGDSFQEVATDDFVAIGGGEIEIVDFNKDGLVDIAITGAIEKPFSPFGFTDIYLNEGGFRFSRLNLPLEQLTDSEMGLIDLENDGDYDIILTGFDDVAFTAKTLFYQQNEDGFSLIDLGLPDLLSSAVGVADLDNNGFDDIVLSGGSNVKPYNNLFLIYLNEGGELTPIESGISGTKGGELDFADFDIDGDLDILLSGDPGPDVDDPSITKIIVNDGKGSFSVFNQNFSGSFRGGIKWGDFDGDLDIDILKIQGENVLYKQDFSPLIIGTSLDFDPNRTRSFELRLNELNVKDVDNTFPNDFSLTVYGGANYAVKDNRIIPSSLSEQLTIPVSVSDGTNESKQFEIQVDFEGVLSLEQPLDDFTIYPIPARDHLNISSNDHEYFSIKVYDINGSAIQTSAKNNAHSLDLSSFAEGIYFIQLTTDKEVILRKFIKK